MTFRDESEWLAIGVPTDFVPSLPFEQDTFIYDAGSNAFKVMVLNTSSDNVTWNVDTTSDYTTCNVGMSSDFST
jgi:hypothetical protein